MIAYVCADNLGRESAGSFVVEPRCGDFCDQCGDCLHCYGGDPCGMGDDEHTWVIYADQAAEFHASHPEAVREGS